VTVIWQSNSAGRFLDTFFDRLSSGMSKAGSHQDRLVFFIIETLFAVTFFSEVIVRCGATAVLGSERAAVPKKRSFGLDTPICCR